jgi:hypothetical protein
MRKQDLKSGPIGIEKEAWFRPKANNFQLNIHDVKVKALDVL